MLMYSTLLRNNFSKSNIYVLYSDGVDFNTTHARYNSTRIYGGPITQWKTNNTSIEKIFTNLANGATNVSTLNGSNIDIPKVTSSDQLFVWWNGHGLHQNPYSYGGDICKTIFETQTTRGLEDSKLAAYISKIQSYSSRILIFQGCCTGGIIGDLNSQNNKLPNTVTMTATDCIRDAKNDVYTEKIFKKQYSKLFPPSPLYTKPIIESIPHSPFNYHLTSAMRGSKPDGTRLSEDPDTNGNGHISIAECFTYTKNRISDQQTAFQNTYHATLPTPQLDDADNIAESLDLF